MEVVVVQAPPDVSALAERLAAAGLPDIAVLSSGRGPVSYVTAAPEEVSHALDPHRHNHVPDGFASLPEWIGVIPYEARRSLERPGWSAPERRLAPACVEPWWLRYPAMVRVADQVTVAGEAAAVRRLSAALERATKPSTEPLRLELVGDADARAHVGRVSRARELILDGDLYQVSLARRLELRLHEGSPLALFRQGSQGCRFGAVIPVGELTMVTMSPELLLRAEATEAGFGQIATEPIKGTRPRSSDAETDAALACELDADPKERAELAMIIDVERHDLGSVCDIGSVRIERLPTVHAHATVHHREARLVGTVRRGTSRQAVIEAMVPSGSVTGAPKIRAMEVIADLEAHRRGLYTGGVGHIERGGSLTLAMAIRTVELRGERAYYWTGGGIVADSDPERELLETTWKAQRLLELVQRRVGA